eukprot:403366236
MTMAHGGGAITSKNKQNTQSDNQTQDFERQKSSLISQSNPYQQQFQTYDSRVSLNKNLIENIKRSIDRLDPKLQSIDDILRNRYTSKSLSKNAQGQSSVNLSRFAANNNNNTLLTKNTSNHSRQIQNQSTSTPYNLYKAEVISNSSINETDNYPFDENSSLLNSYLKQLKAEYKQPKVQTYLQSEMIAISLDDREMLQRLHKDKEQKRRLEELIKEQKQQLDKGSLNILNELNNEESTDNLENGDQFQNSQSLLNKSHDFYDYLKRKKRFLSKTRQKNKNFVFTTVGRDQREVIEQKYKQNLPEVGKYYPKYGLILNRPQQIEFSRVFEKPGRSDPIVMTPIRENDNALSSPNKSIVLREGDRGSLERKNTIQPLEESPRHKNNVYVTQNNNGLKLPSINSRYSRNQQVSNTVENQKNL